MTPSFNAALVLASIAVAVLASYTALALAERVARTQGRSALLWVLGGALAMGSGIWAMHFVGMLAFSLPVPLGYDVPRTLGSWIVAVVSSMFALWVVSHKDLTLARLAVGGLLLGLGIAAMHYVGMSALLMQPAISYQMVWFSLSVFIAISASAVALWLAFRLKAVHGRTVKRRLGAALVMGAAIAGMHYTGMQAARFLPGSICTASNTGVDTGWLALLVILASCSILAITLVVAVLDARLQERTQALTGSLEEANAKLQKLALHDALTALPNRMLMSDRIEHSLQKYRREQSPFAVMLLDLDGFKAINDGFGHHAGDALLVGVAQRLRDTVRAQDTIARLGGDEFVLLVEVHEPHDAAAVAEKLVATIAAPYRIEGHDHHVRASVGIALCPDDGATARELLSHADSAMYYAKGKGGAGFCFFDASMTTDAKEHLQLVTQLRSAVAAGQLEVALRAKRSTTTGRLVGFGTELLWRHPERGLLPGSAFLPTAARAGLMPELGAWTLAQACAQLAALLRETPEETHSQEALTVSVPLFPEQLARAGLTQDVRRAVSTHGVAASCLLLEVPETVAMHVGSQGRAEMAALCSMGVRVVLTGFADAYASEGYVRGVCAHEVEIGGHIVDDVEEGRMGLSVLQPLVAWAKALGMRVTADGVRTLRSVELLTEAGCDSLQGVAAQGAGASDARWRPHDPQNLAA